VALLVAVFLDVAVAFVVPYAVLNTVSNTVDVSLVVLNTVT